MSISIPRKIEPSPSQDLERYGNDLYLLAGSVLIDASLRLYPYMEGVGFTLDKAREATEIMVTLREIPNWRKLLDMEFDTCDCDPDHEGHWCPDCYYDLFLSSEALQIS